MLWADEPDIDQWDSLWFNGGEGRRGEGVNMNNKLNKSMTRLILLSSNKRLAWVRFRMMTLWSAASDVGRFYRRSLNLSLFLFKQWKWKCTLMPNVSQTLPCGAGNVKSGKNMVGHGGQRRRHDWGSDTQELEWEIVEMNLEGSSTTTKRDENSTAELSNMWQCWKWLCLSQSFPLQLFFCDNIVPKCVVLSVTLKTQFNTCNKLPAGRPQGHNSKRACHVRC